MFIADHSSLEYHDPWLEPLDERIRILARAKYKIAYFYESPNNSSFRYRAYNMTQALNASDDIEFSASYFFTDDLDYIDNIADIANLLVICRSRYNSKINNLILKFKIRKKSVIFDIDDFVFNSRYTHLIINTLDQDIDNNSTWDEWFAMTSRLGETLKLCDGAITTNTYLATKIAEYSGLPVRVVPNFINKEQLDFSESIYLNKVALKFKRNDKISLGYFSGSPSHNLDFAIITAALEDVLENDQRVELMIVGYIEPSLNLRRFGGRIKYQPFHDYVNLQGLIGSVEFNLMPLQYNCFTNCKSELKYFEAAIVGTLSIASPSFTYASSIEDGKNGYISHAHQWSSVIKRAISNMDAYSDMARKAYEDAIFRFVWYNNRRNIISAINYFK